MAANGEILARALDVATRATDPVADLGVHKEGGALLETMLGRYVLDADARAIWNLIDGRRGVDEIVAAIAESHGADLADIAPAVEAFCSQLTELGLTDQLQARS